MPTFADSAPPADTTLLRCIAGGDAHAFAVLMQRHAPRLKARLRAWMSPADAEDVIQDVMLRVWRAAPCFDAAKGEARAWLDRIARNLAIDHHRRAPPAMIGLDAALPSAAPGALEELLARERLAILQRGLAALPAAQRAALAWRYGERKMAVQVPGRAVEGRVYRARIFLREVLNKAA